MRSLYKYQERTVDILNKHPKGGAAWLEPGLGKTLTAIRAAGPTERVLVVCPVSAIGVWEDELEQDEIYWYVAPEGTRAEKAETVAGAGDWWIILNYEALLDKKVEKAIKSWNPGLVIIDESHKIKTVTAKRSRAVHRICEGRRTYLLSGTPITRNLLDLYSQYKAIDPDIWDGQTWTNFRYKYARYGGYLNKEVVGYRNVDELKDRVRPYSIVLRKDDVLDLPPKTDQRIPTHLTAAQWEAYQDLADGGLWEGEPVLNPLERALRLQQFTGRAKIGTTVDVVAELLEADQKVVVFYRFREEGKRLEASPLSGQVVAHLHGDVPAKRRTEMVRAFQETSGPGVFLAQVSAGATAITLTASSEVVYHSLTWAFEDYFQSRDRVYRIGQRRGVTYRHILATGPGSERTIDKLVLDALQTKQDVAAMITADPSLIVATTSPDPL